MKLILHPGHAKCGSTSIQEFLTRNVNVLKQIKTIVVGANPSGLIPESEAKTLSLNSYFARIIKEKNYTKLKSDLKRLKSDSENKGHQNLIISCEGLAESTSSEKDVLRPVYEIFADSFEEFSITYYIRRQDDWILAAWQQWLHKEGYDIDEFAQSCISNHTPDFKSVLDVLAEVFGQQNIHAAPIESEFLYKKDLIQDFIYHSNFDFGNKARFNFCQNNSQSNLGINPELCEILSRIPSIYSDRHDNHVRDMLVQLSKSDDLLFMRAGHVLKYENRLQILKSFSEDNGYINKKYFKKNGTVKWAEDGTEKLLKIKNDNEIDGLKNIVALQTKIIINLWEELNDHKEMNTFKSQIKSGIKKVINWL